MRRHDFESGDDDGCGTIDGFRYARTAREALTFKSAAIAGVSRGLDGEASKTGPISREDIDADGDDIDEDEDEEEEAIEANDDADPIASSE